jgi:hypothetical protein
LISRYSGGVIEPIAEPTDMAFSVAFSISYHYLTSAPYLLSTDTSSTETNLVMESYILPNFPREVSSIHLCWFQNVTNSASLRTRLVEAATMEGEQGDKARDEMDYGFVEASMVRLCSLVVIRRMCR